MASFLGELRRRNVFKVAVAYAIVGWFAIEVAATMLPIFEAPEWILQVFTFFVILGFPVAIVLSWIYDFTPQGIERTSDASETVPDATGSKLNYAIVGLLLLAVGFMFVDNYVLLDDAEQPAEEVAETDDEAEPGVSPNSIAVLAFENMSADPEQEYFSDGISEEILNGLAQIGSLHVAARTSAFSFKGQNVDIPSVGQALNVAHVLEGSVRKAGNQVRITAQLIEVESGFHLWSDEYDRELTDIFAVQDDIANAVVEALRVELLGEETTERTGGYLTASVEAHDAYLLGRHRLATRRTDDLAAARAYFEQAIELDPDYAAAYVGLADSVMLQNVYGATDAADLRQNAEPAIARALELDSSMGEAYASRAFIRTMFAGDFAGADPDYRRAIELSPNYAAGYHWYSIALAFGLGQIDEAIEIGEKALELDPLSLIISTDLAVIWSLTDNIDRTRELLRRSVEIDPSFAKTYWRLAQLEISAGRISEGLRLLRTAAALDPGNPYYPALVATTYLDLGNPATAELWFEHAADVLVDNPLAQFYRDYVSAAVRRENTDGLAPLLAQLPVFDVRWQMDPMLFFGPALLTNDLAAIRAFFERVERDLYSQSEPFVGIHNVAAAVDMAWLLLAEGDNSRAEELLEICLTVLRSAPPNAVFRGTTIVGIPEVEAPALLGREDEALAAMQRMIDRGWRSTWWLAESSPKLASISSHPDFVAMIDEVKADMAAQLEVVREMENSGEFPPMPEAVSAP
ncbi:MAG TPA: tetratricopeptide repeat protein [Gammaproteobacteria bacterium]